jgi:hypothetical protein
MLSTAKRPDNWRTEMTKMQVPAEMIEAVKAVHPSERRTAMLVAERTFLNYLAKLREWGDFDEDTHVEMAAGAAAAEVAYKFA